jgi:hypothetical protein
VVRKRWADDRVHSIELQPSLKKYTRLVSYQLELVAQIKRDHGSKTIEEQLRISQFMHLYSGNL